MKCDGGNMDTGMEYVGNCKLSGINPGETWLPQSKPGKVIPIPFRSGGESSRWLLGKADEAKAPAPAPWSWCPSRACAVLIPRPQGTAAPRSTPLAAQFRPYALPRAGATLPLGEVVLEDLPASSAPCPSEPRALPRDRAAPCRFPPRGSQPRMVQPCFAAPGALPGERAASGGSGRRGGAEASAPRAAGGCQVPSCPGGRWLWPLLSVLLYPESQTSLRWWTV